MTLYFIPVHCYFYLDSVLCFALSQTKVGVLIRHHVFHFGMVSVEQGLDPKMGVGRRKKFMLNEFLWVGFL